MLRSIIIPLTFLFISCGQDKSPEADAIAQTGATISNPENGPSVTALIFINSYVDNCNKFRDAIGIQEWVNSSSLVTPKFKAELKKLLDEAYRQDSRTWTRC